MLPEEYEPVLFEGIVTGYEGSVITVEGGEGTNSFDISRNEEDPDQPVIRGCYVEVSYADSPVNGVYPADSVSVLNDNEQLAEEQGRDPVIYGRLQYMDINEITIFDDAGRTIDFDGAIARSVSFGELGSGDEVAVTYCGSIHREETSGEGLFGGVPFALKVVAMDALRSEEAQANYVEGTAGAISGGNMTLSTEIGDLECSADPAVYEGIAENDKIRVFYTGSLADIVLAVERVEKL